MMFAALPHHLTRRKNCVQQVLFPEVDMSGSLLGRDSLWLDFLKRLPHVSDHDQVLALVWSGYLRGFEMFLIDMRLLYFPEMSVWVRAQRLPGLALFFLPMLFIR